MKKQYQREITIELLWIELCENPAWKYQPWKEYYKPKMLKVPYSGAGTDQYVDDEIERIKRAYRI